jgi:hypothetical protein
MIRVGLLPAGISRRVLEQRPARPDLAELPRFLLGVVREPRLIARLWPTLWRMPRLQWHYSRYPAERADLPRWRTRLQRLES